VQNNYDLVDYVNTLREGILEAYTGVVGGLKTGGKADLLLPYIADVFTFLHLTLTDQDRSETILRSAIGLLGDLAEAFPNGQLKEPLNSPWVGDLLKAGRTKLGGSETKKVAKWAREVRRLVSCSQQPHLVQVASADGSTLFLSLSLSLFLSFADGASRDAVRLSVCCLTFSVVPSLPFFLRFLPPSRVLSLPPTVGPAALSRSLSRPPPLRSSSLHAACRIFLFSHFS